MSMLRDVFYYGKKPNVHPREQYAEDLNDARKKATTEHFWIINEFCDYRNFDWDFDFDFLPDEDMWAENHNNVWPSQHQKDSGTWLCPKEHSDIIIYRNDVDPVRRNNETSDNWVELDLINYDKFDFSWHPDPTDPPYIYKWGCKFYPAQVKHVLEYRVSGATQDKYMDTVVELLPKNDLWIEHQEVDKTKFDMTWRPSPFDPPFIYVWGNKYIDGKTFPTIEYHVPGATDRKYMDEYVSVLPQYDRWEIPESMKDIEFDFAWRPNPKAPPYIYQFGTMMDNHDGPRYATPNHNGVVVYMERNSESIVNKYYITTTLEDLVKQHPDELFWALRKNIEYTGFDFSWRPTTVEVAYELDYVHVFGSPESELTQTYFVSAEHYLRGKTEFKFVEDLQLNEDTLAKLFKKPDIFFIDKSNSESQARFDKLKERFPNIQKTRYLNSWVDTINRCTKKATTELVWILNSELDYTDFNFDYYPNPWQMKMVHVFGTQHSHWGTTWLINTETFGNDTKYIKDIDHLSNLNFVKNMKAKADICTYDIVFIDHGNIESEEIKNLITEKTGKNVISIRYDESYFNTIKHLLEILPQKKENYVWLCSSICDYTNFDFSYICDPFAREQLHVFPSGTQKFGDTFLVNVNVSKELFENISMLEQHPKLNFNYSIMANRLPEPVIIHNNDTHVGVLSYLGDFPYTTFITDDNKDISHENIEPMNLWSSETKNILVTSTGATRIVVPKEAKSRVHNELYDYPYIKKLPTLALSKPLDIVYLSNGETGAEENYEHLLNVTKGLPNRVVRVNGVNGRVAAYHAAAEASETPWMFTVFAKLKVNPKFDWNWQPDRMQCPKHYIFHAKNPVNGLIYGHQAMIAYNKKLTLANEGKGLDFTLDDEHEVVPLISGTAQYNTDEFSTWRTAFREVIKLKADISDVAKDRLDAWLNKAEGDFAQYSIKGALDAEKYYDEVNGDFDMLKLSYEWDWLRNKFNEM